MVVNLLATARGFMNQSLRATLNEGLNCSVSGHGGNEYDEDFLNLNNDPYLWDQFSRCGFPGNQFFRYLTTTFLFLPLVIVTPENATEMWRTRTVLRYGDPSFYVVRLLYRLHTIEFDYDDFVLAIKKNRGWMTGYNVEHEFSSPLRVDELMTDHSRIYRSLLSMIRPFQESLSGVFDKYTVSEWIEQRVYPMIRQMEKIKKEAHDLKAKKTWAKRPFPMLKDLMKIGVTDRDPSTPFNDDT